MFTGNVLFRRGYFGSLHSKALILFSCIYGGECAVWGNFGMLWEVGNVSI